MHQSFGDINVGKQHMDLLSVDHVRMNRSQFQ